MEDYMSELSWKYVKELKDKAVIDVFEKEHGFSFPTDLKDILLKYNGGRPSLRYFDTDTEKDKEFKTLLSFNESDIETIFKCYPLDSADSTLIPFASNSGGDYFVLKNNAIHLWNHESDTSTFLASSFTDFLNLLHD